MFTTSHYHQDYLNPAQCLQLLGLGLTDQTPFYWAVDRVRQVASFQQNRGPKETNLEFEGLSRVPAYSIAALLSVFSSYRLNKSRYEYVLELPLPFSDQIHIEQRSPILSHLVFETIRIAVANKAYTLQHINLTIHQYNAQPYA